MPVSPFALQRNYRLICCKVVEKGLPSPSPWHGFPTPPIPLPPIGQQRQPFHPDLSLSPALYKASYRWQARIDAPKLTSAHSLPSSWFLNLWMQQASEEEAA